MTGMELMESLDWFIPIGFILSALMQLVHVFVVPLLLWKLVMAIRENTEALYAPGPEDVPVMLRVPPETPPPAQLIHNTEEYLR